MKKIINLSIIILCLYGCATAKESTPIKANYNGTYHTSLDYEIYLKYHGYFISEGKLLEENNYYEAYDYCLGGDAYQIIVLNDIEYELDAYDSNRMYNGSSYCENNTSCSINLNDYFYIYDNLLLSLNTPSKIIDSLKANPIKDSTNLDYYKDGNVFTIDEFMDVCSLNTKEIIELENNKIGIDAYRNVEITFEDNSKVLLSQIEEDYINTSRNNISDQIANLYDTSCFLNGYCIKDGNGDDGYIVCQNLMLKVINDNGNDFESLFRNMNY